MASSFYHHPQTKNICLSKNVKQGDIFMVNVPKDVQVTRTGIDISKHPLLGVMPRIRQLTADENSCHFHLVDTKSHGIVLQASTAGSAHSLAILDTGSDAAPDCCMVLHHGKSF